MIRFLSRWGGAIGLTFFCLMICNLFGKPVNPWGLTFLAIWISAIWGLWFHLNSNYDFRQKMFHENIQRGLESTRRGEGRPIREVISEIEKEINTK